MLVPVPPRYRSSVRFSRTQYLSLVITNELGDSPHGNSMVVLYEVLVVLEKPLFRNIAHPWFFQWLINVIPRFLKYGFFQFFRVINLKQIPLRYCYCPSRFHTCISPPIISLSNIALISSNVGRTSFMSIMPLNF